MEAQITEAKATTITQETAIRILKENSYPSQRNVKKWHLQRLKRSLTEGTFPPTTTIWFAKLGRLVYLVDGQHRITACAETGVPFQAVMSLVEVGNDEELKELYLSYDKGTARTFSDAIVSSGITRSTNLNQQQVRLTSGAVKVIMDGFRMNHAGNSQNKMLFRESSFMLEQVEEWSAEAYTFFNLMQDTPILRRRLMSRQSCMSIALVALREDYENAMKFWGAVAENSGLKKGQPAHRLVEELMAMSLRNNSVAREARTVAACWNAYIQDKTMVIARPIASESPIKILNTKYTGEYHIKSPVCQ